MKLYIDTSVFGGYFEIEFSQWSKELIDNIIGHSPIYTAVISDMTITELADAPKRVRDLSDTVISRNAEFVIADIEAKNLAEKYLKEKIVTPKFYPDALHIAIATINKVDVLTSWNFKHIVNLNRIRLYNSVNLKYGYSLIEIRSPKELVV